MHPDCWTFAATRQNVSVCKLFIFLYVACPWLSWMHFVVCFVFDERLSHLYAVNAMTISKHGVKMFIRWPRCYFTCIVCEFHLIITVCFPMHCFLLFVNAHGPCTVTDKTINCVFTIWPLFTATSDNRFSCEFLLFFVFITCKKKINSCFANQVYTVIN